MFHWLRKKPHPESIEFDFRKERIRLTTNGHTHIIWMKSDEGQRIMANRYRMLKTLFPGEQPEVGYDHTLFEAPPE